MVTTFTKTTVEKTTDFANLISNLTNKTDAIALVGLGYVGLPIALEFGNQFRVVGFDINERRVAMMQNHQDPSGELEPAQFEGRDISFTANLEDLENTRFYVVAVPTPIDAFKQPDLRALKAATGTVGKTLKKGDYVVFESTVYPGCTEEVCIPILEKNSGLTFNVDFKVGYSPERINPGDKTNTIDKIVKIVSGCCDVSLDQIAQVYESIITAGIHRAPSIKVAEAAKIVENTQRDVNIALMNELSQIFDNLGINTYEVLEAAGTKWNFLKFYPGLVGGHCIGVDPYYLIQKAIRSGHNPILISAGRAVNDSMPGKIAMKIAKQLEFQNKDPRNCKALVMGATFKENVTDIRNSKAADLIQALKHYCGQVDVVDPLASPEEMRSHYKIEMRPTPATDYDVVVVAVSHEEYMNLTEEDFLKMCKSDALFVDIKGIKRGQIEKMIYCSL